jgi:hypothetical protein
MMSAVKRLLLTARLACFRLTTRERWAFGVCAVFKDESLHLEEWLEFHSLMGVEHFFLYNDRSTDAFMTVLQPWIDSGRVTLRPSKNRKQDSIYNHCLRSGAARCRWIAFIDLDEFLFSPEAVSLPEAMERYSTVPAVFVHWILFGSGGHLHAPQKGTVDSYTKSMGLNASISDDFVHKKIGTLIEYVTGDARDGKSIVDPRAVIEMGVHMPQLLKWGSTVTETFGKPHPRSPAGIPFTCDILRINHYWSKSVEELTQKVLKGHIRTSGPRRIDLERSLQRETLLNQIEDRVIIDVREHLLASRTPTTS